MLLLGLFPFVGSVGQIYALIFAINVATALFTPTFEAALPEVVGSQLYPRALSMSRVAVDLEAAGGPLVAGVLMVWVGVRWTFWFDGFTYLASALLVAASRVPRAPAPRDKFPWPRFLPEVTHGTRVLLREPALRKALVLHFAEAAAGAAVIVTTVVYVREVLRMGNSAFAIVMAGVGLGSSLTGIVLARRSTRVQAALSDPAQQHLALHSWTEHALVLGGVFLAASLLPAVATPGLVLLALLWVLNGAGQALIAIPSVALLAEHSAPAERGRAYAAHFALTHLFWLITYPAAGYLARALGTSRAFTITGFFCAGLTVVAALIRAPHHHQFHSAVNA
jgi:NRE family putative nickel resistance protein-like MFS transporter